MVCSISVLNIHVHFGGSCSLVRVLVPWAGWLQTQLLRGGVLLTKNETCMCMHLVIKIAQYNS